MSLCCVPGTIPCLGKKMVGKIDVVPALLELTASWGNRSFWEEKVGKWSSSKSTLKSLSMSTPGLGTAQNTSNWSQKLFFSPYSAVNNTSFSILVTQGRQSREKTT